MLSALISKHLRKGVQEITTVRNYFCLKGKKCFKQPFELIQAVDFLVNMKVPIHALPEPGPVGMVLGAPATEVLSCFWSSKGG